MILKASFQNWVPSRILVAGSMCQIIPVRLVRLLYFRVFISDGCKQHWFVSKLKLVSFKIGVGLTRRTVGSADICMNISIYIYMYVCKSALYGWGLCIWGISKPKRHGAFHHRRRR